MLCEKFVYSNGLADATAASIEFENSLVAPPRSPKGDRGFSGYEEDVS